MQLLVGSYSDGLPAGVRLVEFDPRAASLSLIATLDGAPDASFFAYERTSRHLYVTDEMGPRIGAFALSHDARRLMPLGYEPAEAAFPCYVALGPDAAHLAAANYGSDLVLVFALDSGGALRSNPQRLHGIKPADQGHAHWVQWSPEGDRLYAVDLGHDEIRFWPYDRASGQIGSPAVAFAMPEKSGPRHLAFHPNGRFAYCLTEYANTLTAFAREQDGTLRELGTYTTLPPDFGETSYGAHIQISAAGDRVYVSNRGHNSIAVFGLAADGTGERLQVIDCGGDWPRFFLRLDRHLIVANQKSDQLCLFGVEADGTLTQTAARLSLPQPVMILPV